MQTSYLIVYGPVDYRSSQETVCVCATEQRAKEIIQEIKTFLKEEAQFQKDINKFYCNWIKENPEPIKVSEPTKENISNDKDWYINYTKKLDQYNNYAQKRCCAKQKFIEENFKKPTVTLSKSIIKKISFYNQEYITYIETDLF